MAGAPGKGWKEGIAAIEPSDRVLLTLFGLFLLLVFMDYQAARHYHNVAPDSRAPVLEIDRWSRQAEEAGSHASDLLRQGDEYARQELSRTTDGARDHAQELERDASDQAREWRDEAVDGAQEFGRETEHTIRREAADRAHGAVDQLVAPEPLQQRGVARMIPFSGDEVFLYFVRFKGGSSELVRVTRPMSPGQLRLTAITSLLQRGPEMRERGIINNFTWRIRVHDLYMKSEGVVVLDVDEEMARMEAHTIQDRLDQIVYTLTQFAPIQAVELRVNGRAVNRLGSGAGVRVPTLLTRRARPVYTLDGEDPITE